MRYDAKKSTALAATVMMFKDMEDRTWENSATVVFSVRELIFGGLCISRDPKKPSGFEPGFPKAIRSGSSATCRDTVRGRSGGSSPTGWTESRRKILISLATSISSMMGLIFIKTDVSSASWTVEARRSSPIPTTRRKATSQPWDGFGRCGPADCIPFISQWMESVP